MMGILIPATLLSSMIDKDISKIFLYLIVADFIAIILGYAYFAFANPSMLRSEDHEIALRQLMGDDRSGARITVIEGEITANTHAAEIGAGGNER
jgi:hypothetical protein